MKTRHTLPTLSFCLLLALTGTARTDQTIPGNVTIQGGLIVMQTSNLYGNALSFGHLADNVQLPGFLLGLSQLATTTETSLLTPGYYTQQEVVVEDYGMRDLGNWVQDWGYVTVDDYYPAVYDLEGNLVSEESWGSHQDYQMIGQHWNPNESLGVVGTHTETQDVWVPDAVANVTVTNYGAPHVAFNASRSDTNYDFVFPSETGSGNQWTALSIYSGGLTMKTEDTSRGFALTPWSLQQTGTSINGAALGAGHSAEGTSHISSRTTWVPGTGNRFTNSTGNLSADALQLTYREGSSASVINAQTQITARSAQFAGAVTVEGNLNAKGSLRVLPAGDLSMGAYHKGTRPDGTIDSGN